jgi:hypothetical protein
MDARRDDEPVWASGRSDRSRMADSWSRFYALAGAVAAVAADLADAEDRVAAVLVRSAAVRPHRASDLLALSAQARRRAAEIRALHARWHDVATGGPSRRCG